MLFVGSAGLQMKKGTTPHTELPRPATALASRVPEKAATIGVKAKLAVRASTLYPDELRIRVSRPQAFSSWIGVIRVEGDRSNSDITVVACVGLCEPRFVGDQRPGGLRCPILRSVQAIELGRRGQCGLVRRTLQLRVHRCDARIIEGNSAGRNQSDERERDGRRDCSAIVPQKSLQRALTSRRPYCGPPPPVEMVDVCMVSTCFTLSVR